MLGSISTTLDALLGLQNALDRSRRADFFGMGTTGSGVYPAINLFEHGHDLLLTAELPGVKKEDLKIEIERDRLRLSGSRAVDYGKDASVHRAERRSLNFDRTLQLPVNVDADKIKAELVNGVLALHLPRAEADKPRQITIH